MLVHLTVVAANLAAAGFSLLSWTPAGPRFRLYGVDLDVYRICAQVLSSGGDLYGRLPVTSQGVRLSFTYPSVAVIVFCSLSAISMAVAFALLYLASIAVLAVVLGAVARGAQVLAWRLPVALMLEPVRSTLIYGQINPPADGVGYRGLLRAPDVAARTADGSGRWSEADSRAVRAVLPGPLRFPRRRVAALSFSAATRLGFLLTPGDAILDARCLRGSATWRTQATNRSWGFRPGRPSS